jgi:acyl-CoA-binding protein
MQKLLNQKPKNRQLLLLLPLQNQRKKARNKNDPLEIVNFKTFKKHAWTKII